jgi:hypothetical protein
MEFALRIGGTAAKETAAFLIAAFKSDSKSTKLRGKERLTTMLKSGKELKIFSLDQKDLQQFAKEAKRYGVVYTVLMDKKQAGGLVDIMCKAEDASKLNRIMERLDFAAVDRATITGEPAPEQAEQTEQDTERPAMDKDDTEKLLDLLLDEDGKAKTDTPDQQEAHETQNPLIAERGNAPPSGQRSATPSKSDKATPRQDAENRPSVRERLNERKAVHAKAEEQRRAEPEKAKPIPTQETNTHNQPQGRKKPAQRKER